MTRPPPVLAAVGIGSNVGDRAAHLRAALAAIDALPGASVVAASSFIETAPVAWPGSEPGGPYLNAAALVDTTLPADTLLRELLRIERERGRDRSAAGKWGPRTLDLDLLLYGDRIIDDRAAGLTVPHPRMHERRFVLVPLAQIAADLVVPGREGTVKELLAALPLPTP